MQSVTGTCRISGYTVAYAGATHPGRVRRCNEDNLLIVPDSGLFAVADGLGGLDAGDVASSAALAHLADLAAAPTTSRSDLLFARFWADTRRRQFEAMILEVNRRTYAQRVALGKNMATTLAVLLLHERQALIGHVGDSRIYLFRQHTLHQLTSDHSLVNDLVLQGALTAAQAKQSPQRHVITRAIGAEPTVVPTVTELTLQAGDQLLLCTDGLTSMVADADIAQWFAACGDTPDQDGTGVERLINLANAAGGQDNITVVQVEIVLN
jgi:protein phosphatase